MTSYLEKLIHEGKAVYQNFVAGGGGSSILTVGKGSYIVITDITSFHYSNLGPTQSLDLFNQNSVYQMSLLSSLSQNHFIFKCDVAVNSNDVFGQARFFTTGSTKLDTYLIHKTDVKIDFLTQPELPWVPTNGDTPPGVSQFPPPIGYGSGAKGVVSTVLTIEYAGAAGSTSPISSTYTPAGIDPAFNGLQFPSNSFTRYTFLGPALLANASGRAYPLANIGYVKIMSPKPDSIFGTS